MTMNIKSDMATGFIVLAILIGFSAEVALGYGACQWCDLTTPGGPCPASCTTGAVKGCVFGACNAAAMATGTCKWGLGYCSRAACPTGRCIGGSTTCQCSSGGCG